jgi:hypothetical protein
MQALLILTNGFDLRGHLRSTGDVVDIVNVIVSIGGLFFGLFLLHDNNMTDNIAKMCKIHEINSKILRLRFKGKLSNKHLVMKFSRYNDRVFIRKTE